MNIFTYACKTCKIHPVIWLYPDNENKVFDNIKIKCPGCGAGIVGAIINIFSLINNWNAYQMQPGDDPEKDMESLLYRYCQKHYNNTPTLGDSRGNLVDSIYTGKSKENYIASKKLFFRACCFYWITMLAAGFNISYLIWGIFYG